MTEDVDPVDIHEQKGVLAIELAFPNKIGKSKEITLYGKQVMVEEIEGKYVYQGDIVLDLRDIEEMNVKSFGRPRFSRNWPKNTVTYEIDPALPNKERVEDAIANYEANTNLYFKKRTTETGGYILFRPSSSGCSTTSIGFLSYSRVQYINLSLTCSAGQVIHEIGHAIGFWHEHIRDDRNSFVKVNYDNIQTGKTDNFSYPGFLFFRPGRTEYTSDLDFNSIMMYHPCSYANACLPKQICNCDSSEATITTTDGSLYPIQRTALSRGDIKGVNLKYPKIYPNKISFEGDYNDMQIWKAGDFDGDNVTDQVSISHTTNSNQLKLVVYIENIKAPVVWFEDLGEYNVTDQWVVGDFFGRGVDDVVRVYDMNGLTQIDVFVSLSTFFTRLDGYNQSTSQQVYDPEAKWVVGDFNGNGSCSIGRISDEDNSLAVDMYYVDNTIGSFKFESWSVSEGVFKTEDNWLAGDFDGDGKDDFVQVQNNNGLADFEMYRSKYYKSFEQNTWASGQGSIWKDMNWVVGDFNGDGKDDIGKSFDQFGKVAIDVHKSKGSSFGLERWYTFGSDYRNFGTWTVGDFDGNGKSDMMEVYENPISPGKAVLEHYASFAK